MSEVAQQPETCSIETQDSAASKNACGASSNFLECVQGSGVAIRSKKLQELKQCGAAKYDEQDGKSASGIG
ncbi:hypothetical protein CQ12_10480 [Bradyrhizobium jicamae]|uniref:Uncharacterized protein n=1 Tax=Bradyrhizobium jicamae TaxID=280332 RepID=A0A0R3LRE4_9BRAD|nr:hypothetical protein CQ12_10480 [Bradyrhizobium jicamae]